MAEQSSKDLRKFFYDEVIGRLELRKTPVVALGVEYPSEYISEAATSARNELLLVFGGAAVLVAPSDVGAVVDRTG